MYHKSWYITNRKECQKSGEQTFLLSGVLSILTCLLGYPSLPDYSFYIVWHGHDLLTECHIIVCEPFVGKFWLWSLIFHRKMAFADTRFGFLTTFDTLRNRCFFPRTSAFRCDVLRVRALDDFLLTRRFDSGREGSLRL